MSALAKTGRPRSCDCGDCRTCKKREQARARYQALTLEERREVIGKRDKDKARATDRARYYRDPESRRARMKDWVEKNRERSRELKRASAKRFPEKQSARATFGNAIRDGKLARQPCEKCGDPKTQGHHFDYSKPLEVIWLCSLHHGEAHRAYPLPFMPTMDGTV